MKLARIEDFEVYKKADAFSDALTAILERPGFGKEFNLRNQIANAVDSVLSNMSEGFEQPTDKAFASYLYKSKGSMAEACTRLRIARRRKLVSETEFHELAKRGAEINQMTNGLIKHLMKTPNRRRGLGLTTND